MSTSSERAIDSLVQEYKDAVNAQHSVNVASQVIVGVADPS
ncbi:hypothetical protein ACFXA3_35695 [Streptomyces sp. NPDC059456]